MELELELKVKDTFYISHGLARVIIRDSVVAKKFLESWKQKVYPQTPSAILVVSSHWDTVVPTVNVVHDHNQTLYDFPGLQYPQSIYNLSFCQALYEFKYPAPGAPHLAKRVKELLNAHGFKHVEEAIERGLDHGAWNPLMLMYPEGDIPVCQLSIQSEQDASHHYNMGRALAPLKDEGVLIIGSGSAIHNVNSLHYLSNSNSSVESWAQEFDDWMTDALLDGRYEEVIDYEERAPHARMAHPWPDHLYPLHVALGAAGDNAKAKLIHGSFQMSTLSYSSYRFTSP